jgi:thiamine transport system permease protein
VLRIVGGFWSNLDPQIGAAARVLGANRWRALWEVTLPLLRPSILAASLLVFLFDFTSFGVILILGGPRFNTLETAIYRSTQITFNLPLATALALVQLACTFAMMAVYTRLQARASVPIDLRSQRVTQRRPSTRREKAMVAIVVGSMLAFLLLAGSPRSALRRSGLTLAYYTNLATNPRARVVRAAAGGDWQFVIIGGTMITLGVGVMAARIGQHRQPARVSEPGVGRRLLQCLEPTALIARRR